jgi:hypothetical protein
MERFFFHIIHSDHRVADPEGAEFKDIRAAQEEAAATLRDLIADALMEGKPSGLKEIEVADGQGSVLVTIDIGSAIGNVLRMFRGIGSSSRT